MQKLPDYKLPMLLKPGLQSLLTRDKTSSAKAGRTPAPDLTLSNL